MTKTTVKESFAKSFFCKPDKLMIKVDKSGVLFLFNYKSVFHDIYTLNNISYNKGS